MVPQLFLYCFRRLRDEFLRDLELVHLHPRRMRYPLRSKALDVLDCVVGGIEQEAPNQIEAFVVGNMGCGLLRARFAIEILFHEPLI